MRSPLLLLVPFALTACSSLRSPLPLAEGPPPEPLSSAVYAGHAAAFRHAEGAWAPQPEYDYDFVVFERRFADRWEVVKQIHRRHPRYDGRAGPRDQVVYFSVHTMPTRDGGLDLTVESTLGRGSGHEEPGGGGVVLELEPAQKGWFVPFDGIRIRQRPSAEGRLEETVELFSRRKGVERPFMRMEEAGLVYRPVLDPGHLPRSERSRSHSSG